MGQLHCDLPDGERTDLDLADAERLRLRDHQLDRSERPGGHRPLQRLPQRGLHRDDYDCQRHGQRPQRLDDLRLHGPDRGHPGQHLADLHFLLSDHAGRPGTLHPAPMICSFFLLPRLHLGWRRRLVIFVFLMALPALWADVAPVGASGSAAAGAQLATAPVTAPVTLFSVGSSQIATATGAPLANLGTNLTSAQAQAAYTQYTALQTQLLEARRQAVLAVSQASDDAGRAKIWGAYLAAQKDNFALLHQLHAQVIPLEKQARVQAAAARKAAPAVAAPPPPAAAAALFSKLAPAK